VGERIVRKSGLVGLTGISLLLALFFAFVGWMKTTAPLELLAAHHAWTVHLPEAVGRIVGVSELVCALLLIAGLVPAYRRPGSSTAAVLIVNQTAAALAHAGHGEMEALPQNAVLTALCASAILLHRRLA
jgi:putative copper export protein